MGVPFSINARVGAGIVFLFAYVIVLKVSYPEIYEALLKRKPEGHSAVELLAQTRSRGLDEHIYQSYVGMIQAHLNMKVANDALTEFLRSADVDVKDLFGFFTGLLNSR